MALVQHLYRVVQLVPTGQVVPKNLTVKSWLYLRE